MSAISLFEEKQVRRAWNASEQKWVFAIVDVTAILTDSLNPQVYWRVMKKRLTDEGNETVTNCNGLKMTAADGKQRMTDVADNEQLLRLIQSIPSPKAEPFKRWLAKVGYERLKEIEKFGRRLSHESPKAPGWMPARIWKFQDQRRIKSSRPSFNETKPWQATDSVRKIVSLSSYPIIQTFNLVFYSEMPKRAPCQVSFQKFLRDPITITLQEIPIPRSILTWKKQLSNKP